jgi:glycosyltransferase involved in cell wall biosynthesis/SAM-dependent methyltransferase
MSTVNVAKLYDAYYFATGCGLPYTHEEKHWATFFGGIADRLQNDFPGACILDAGCALGFLVHALRNRGIEAYGIDLSEYAIENVSESVRHYCHVRSVTDPLPRPYDLIVCIEVLEHLQSEDAEAAVANFCRHADDVILSSSPYDYREPTHFNVQPPDYWVELFARNGFSRDLDYDASYITKWAVRFRKIRDPLPRLVRTYERKLWQLEKEVQATRETNLEQRTNLIRLEEEVTDVRAAHARLVDEHTKAVESVVDEWTEHEKALRHQYEAHIANQAGVIESLEEQRRLTEQHANNLDALYRDSELLYRQCQSARAEAENQCRARVLTLETRVAEREAALKAVTNELHQKNHALLEGLRTIDSLGQELLGFQASRGYRAAKKVSAWRKKLLPAGSYRYRLSRLAYRAVSVWYRHGIMEVVKRSIGKIHRKLRPPALLIPVGETAGHAAEAAAAVPELTYDEQYAAWIKQNEPPSWELEQQARATFACSPLVSIVVPAYQTPIPFLADMVHSVQEQTYAHWELCVADGGSPDPLVQQTLEAYAARDPRIHVKRLERNFGIAGNSNEALAMASGDYVCLLDHDDTLAPFALFEILRAINKNSDADFLYSDEDKIDAAGRVRSQPHFKPDWSADTLRSHNYICHLSCFRRDLLEKTGGFRTGFDGSQDYDLILRAAEAAHQIVHIPKVLYHWRMHETSCAAAPEAKMYAYDSAKKALGEHLERIGLQGTVKNAKTLGVYEIDYTLSARPLISIIIPSKDNRPALERCLASILRSSYENYEVIIVENNSSEAETFDYYAELSRDPCYRVITWSAPFNYSSVNNFGVEHARGEVLLFLNNDIEAINADWLERMLQYIQRPDVGAVGAKLYYPNDTIQHGGVVIGLGGVAGHAHEKTPGWHYGYFGRLIVTQNLSAVTAACLMTTRKIFDEVGGFDPRYVLAFNDVDFCAKIRRQGLLIVWTPSAELYHHESLTRGQEDTPDKLTRFIRESELFATQWCDLLEAGDPYYNPAFTLLRPDFSLKLAPEGAWKLSDFLRATGGGKASVAAKKTAA